MNKTTSKNLTVWPQTVEVPQPLEIHPSVDPELARGLIAAVDYIEAHPETFSMTNGTPRLEQPGGCIICHAERLSSWRRDGEATDLLNPLSRPLGHWIRIFSPMWHLHPGRHRWDETSGRIARIEHFLRTGE